LVATASVTVFGILHHVDHVVRGNHSGWPFQEEVTPFTFSLLIYALLLPGLYLTWRGRLMAGYWLFAAAVLFALVTSVHFVGAEREAPIRDIYAVYDNPAVGLLAVADLWVLMASVVALAGVAIRALPRRDRP
jgi:Zn-dependent membrane protease YugP